MKTLVPDSKYTVSLDFDIKDINQKTLIYLYSPLVGDSLCVYNFFLYEYELINSFNGMPFTIDRATKLLVKNLHSFNKSRQLLEAVNLLETYIQGENVTFKIKKPLSYEQFVKQEHFMEIIKSSVSRNDWLIIETNFNDSSISPEGENISTSFSTVFNRNISSEYDADNCQLTKIARTIHPDIEITDEIRQVMMSSKESLSLAQTKDYLQSSIIKENDKYTIDPEKLFNNINSRSINSVKLSKIDIFTPNNDFDLSQKFEEINNYKSNDYLQSSLKRSLNKKEINVIHHLKYIHGLNNAYINLLIEYVLYKNSGHFVAQYMLKLGETISRNARITNLNTLRDYLVTLTSHQTSEFRTEKNNSNRNQIDNMTELKPSWETQTEEKRIQNLPDMFGDYNG